MADVLESVDSGVAVLTLNRPEARNALSNAMLDGLLEALPRLAADRSVGAVVITGAGGAFCAGGDGKGFASNEGGANQGRSPEEAAYALRQRMEVSRWLHDMPKITIAAIPGAAAGAGLSIALACDFRIAAKGAKIPPAFAKVGIGDWARYVSVDPDLVRPVDAVELRGDATLARDVLGWAPTVGFTELVARMVDADLASN